jgi:hypothetical protein
MREIRTSGGKRGGVIPAYSTNMESSPASVNILCTGRMITCKLLMLARPLAISSMGSLGHAGQAESRCFDDFTAGAGDNARDDIDVGARSKEGD